MDTVDETAGETLSGRVDAGETEGATEVALVAGGVGVLTVGTTAATLRGAVLQVVLGPSVQGAGQTLVDRPAETGCTSVGARHAGQRSGVAELVGGAADRTGRRTGEEVGNPVEVVAGLTGRVVSARGAHRVAGHALGDGGVGVLASGTVSETGVSRSLQVVLSQVGVGLALGALRDGRTVALSTPLRALDALSEDSVGEVVRRTGAQTLVVEEEEVLGTGRGGAVLCTHRTGHTDRAAGLTLVGDACVDELTVRTGGPASVGPDLLVVGSITGHAVGESTRRARGAASCADLTDVAGVAELADRT